MAIEASAASTIDITTIVGTICGLVGVLGGALFANWDKIFRKDKVVQDKVVDYAPSESFEQEIRIMLERTGMRDSVKDLQDRMNAQLEAQLIQDHPEAENQIKFYSGIYQDEMPDYDDFVALLVPIWEKYYSLSAIQELNKFYSTRTMREFTSKSKHVMGDYWPILQASIDDARSRAEVRIEAASAPIESESPDGAPT